MYEGLGDIKGAESLSGRAAGRAAGRRHAGQPRAALRQSAAKCRATGHAAGPAGDRAAAQQEIAAVAHLPEMVFKLRQEELALQETRVAAPPHLAAVQNRTGLIRYSVGWRREAEDALLSASLLEPRNSYYLFHLATYYRDTGRPDQARPLADKLLQLQPQNPVFQQFSAELVRPAGPALPAP